VTQFMIIGPTCCGAATFLYGMAAGEFLHAVSGYYVSDSDFRQEFTEQACSIGIALVKPGPVFPYWGAPP
jgi:hypothetical protein